MLIIRLQRTGKRGQAFFRVVILEHTVKAKGKYLELLGSYNPHKKDLKADAERINYWLKQGVKMSDTVNNLFITKGIIQGEKRKIWNVPKKPIEPSPVEPEPAQAAPEATPEPVAEERGEVPVTEATPAT